MARPKRLLPAISVRRIAMVLGAAILVGVLCAAVKLEAEHATAEAEAGTAATAHAVARSMERMASHFLTTMPDFRPGDLATVGRMHSIAELLRAQAAFGPASAIFLVNKAGRVVSASSPLPGGTLDVGASDWFRMGLQVPRNIVSVRHVDASWLRPGPGVVLTRVLTEANGTPFGLIGALLPIEPAANQPTSDWAIPDWAPAGTLVSVVPRAGEPVVSTTTGSEMLPPSATPRPPWALRAFVLIGGLLDATPIVTSVVPVAHTDLRVIATLPRERVLARAWPSSQPRLQALAVILLTLAVLGLVLARAARRGRTTLVAGPDSVFGYDWLFEVNSESRLTDASGFVPEAVRQSIGRTIDEVICADLANALKRCLGDCDVGAPAEATMLRLADGSGAEQVYRLLVHPQAGGSWRVGGRNVTLEAEATTRAQSIEHAEAAARQEIADLEMERDRVLSAVGHDVRTPMNSILGICSLLLEGELEDEQRQWITRMRASCEALLAMLNGLLEIASLDSGAATLQVCEVDVADLVRQVVDTLAPQASDKGLKLTVCQDDNLSGLWVTDPTRLRQTLFNLVGNAIKYTSRGKVDVRTAVLLGANGQTSIRITVADSGPGIESDGRARIFDRFKRGQAGREHSGIGLGLALCREIADLMGGSLTVESTIGVGSEFSFVFAAEQITERRDAMPYAGCTCVVIGFTGELQRRLPQRLAEIGFSVECAPDRHIGFAVAERTAVQRGTLDLVIIDGALPSFDPAVLGRKLQTAAFGHAPRLLCVVPDGAQIEDLSDIFDRSMFASEGVDAIGRVAGELVGERSPLAALEAGMAEAASQRILIVEDNKLNQALLNAALSRRGFTTFVADCGEDAIRILEVGGFDAVLMDIQMPGIDGLEATRRIRASSAASCGVPIIALTAFSGGLIQRRCEEAGITAIVEKPVNAEWLGHMLRTWIAQSGKSHLAVVDGHIAEAKEETEPAEVLDVFIEGLVAEVGIARARSVVEAFARDAAVHIRRLPELLPGWEVEAIVRICGELNGVATTLGAITLSEGLEALAAAAGRGARDEATHHAARLGAMLVLTMRQLTEVLDRVTATAVRQPPRAA